MTKREHYGEFARGSVSQSKQDRNREIAALVRADDITFAEIGRRYGITRERVRQIAAGEGVEWDNRQRLPDGKVLAALDLIKRGMPMAHAAESVGLPTPEAFSTVLAYRGLHQPVARSPDWLASEVAFLRKHYKQPGCSASVIAERLGRNRNEIIGKAGRLGLCTADEPAKRAARMDSRLRKVVSLRKRGHSWSDIAGILQVPVGTIHGDAWHLHQDGTL